MRFFLYLCLMFITTNLLWAQPVPSSLLNANFEPNANKESVLKGSERSGKTSIQSDDTNHWLQVCDANARVQYVLPVDPKWKKIAVTCQFKTTDVIRGKADWQNARLALRFVDNKFKQTGKWPAIKIHGTGTKNWKTYTQTIDIPEHATSLVVEAGMFGISGCASFDNITISIAKPEKKSPASDLPVPVSIKNIWQNNTAWQEHSNTQSSICLNDLWQFYPLFKDTSARLSIPKKNSGWGYFKVPGIWPPNNPAQTILLSPTMQAQMKREKTSLKKMDQAWYQRKINIPANWENRRVDLDLAAIQTHAKIFIDDKLAGEVFWPGGQCDLTNFVTPGQTHNLAIFVTARPLSGESESWWAAPDTITKRKAKITNKGITGDVYLTSSPKQNRITDVLIQPSVRKHKLAMRVEIKNLKTPAFVLQADIFDGPNKVKTITSKRINRDNITDGFVTFDGDWKKPKLWDLHSPGNLYTAKISLLDLQKKVLNQTLPIEFGFREFWIDGKNFILNGSPVHLRAMEVRNNVSPAADQASSTITTLICKRAKAYGYNTFITHNYGYKPGQVGYADDLYRSTDAQGMLITFSLPHVGHFDWKLDETDIAKRYQQLVQYLVRRVQNHPSIVMYAMNHNATGYKGAANPKKLDGVYDYDSLKGANPDRLKRRYQAEKIAATFTRNIDPTRPVYHHSSGNLGQTVTLNCYLNWLPPQERGDWINHWAKNGKKPLFFVEYGLPHISNWSSFRGPGYIFSTPAKQWIRDAEYASAYLGQAAFNRNDEHLQLLKQRIAMRQQNKTPFLPLIRPAVTSQWPNYHQVQALFCKTVLQDYRAQGISGLLPWDQDYFWHRVTNKRESKPWPNALENLQQPGIKPDKRNAGWFYIYEPDGSLYEDTPISLAIKQGFAPVIAYIAGSENQVTNRACNFAIGDQLNKQLLIINDQRIAISGHAQWQVNGHPALSGNRKFNIQPGRSSGIPIDFTIPDSLSVGKHNLTATCSFDDGSQQQDSFTINVLPRPVKTTLKSRIMVYDPMGDTSKTLKNMGISFKRITTLKALPSAKSIRDQCDLLIVGRKALDKNGYLPQAAAVENGLKILFFEQSAEALQNGLGLRVQELNLRTLWNRVPDHPVMQGITDGHLRNWQGDATSHEPYTPGLEKVERSYQPGVNWNGMQHSRPWRGGNRGTVASVLIEKPTTGSFLPLIDGGFNLQYTPLMIQTLGKGCIVFCQLDVTQRTQTDPAAKNLCMNLLRYMDQQTPNNHRRVYVLGNQAKQTLDQLQLEYETYIEQPLANAILVIGQDAQLTSQPKLLSEIRSSSCHVLGLGLNAQNIALLLNHKLQTVKQETSSQMLKTLNHPLLKGISNAELYWNNMPVFTALKGTNHPALHLEKQGNSMAVYLQVTPELFAHDDQPELRSSYRRTFYMINRLLLNMGANSKANLLPLFKQTQKDQAWLKSVYIQNPITVDDPYRFYGW